MMSETNLAVYIYFYPRSIIDNKIKKILEKNSFEVICYKITVFLSCHVHIGFSNFTQG